MESNRKTMKSALGKRPPDNAHGAPEKKQSSRSSYALLHRSKLKLFANVGDLFDKMLTKSMSKFANVGKLLAKIGFSCIFFFYVFLFYFNLLCWLWPTLYLRKKRVRLQPRLLSWNKRKSEGENHRWDQACGHELSLACHSNLRSYWDNVTNHSALQAVKCSWVSGYHERFPQKARGLERKRRCERGTITKPPCISN